MDKNKDKFNDLKKFLDNKDEKILAVLGLSYITDLIQDILDKSVVILSDKSLYQFGKLIKINRFNMVTSSKGSKEIPIKDITEYSLFKKDNFLLLLMGIIMLAIHRYFYTKYTIPLFLNLLISGSGMALIILHCMKRRKLFTINSTNGSLITDTKWYPEQELKDFQNNIDEIQVSQKQIYTYPSSEFITADIDEKFNNLKEHFKNKKEKIFAILSTKYSNNFLDDVSIKSILILTNKRLYQWDFVSKEKRFSHTNLYNSKVVPLKVIKSHSILQQNFFSLISIFSYGIPGFLLIFFTIGISIKLSIIFAIVAGCILILLNHFIKIKYFNINYPGGSIKVNAHRYSEQEIKDFQAALDKVIAARG